MNEAEIQVAIFNKLQAQASLTDLLVDVDGSLGVYDAVPQAAKSESTAVYPFVTIGDDDNDSWDTDNTDGYESDIRVHTWSRHRGRIEAKRIQAEVHTALHHANLFIIGGDAVLIHFVTSNVDSDPDGRTRHGVQTFRLLSEKN